MRARLYPVERPGRPGRLSIARRPRGGSRLAADVVELSRLGVDVLVSMLSDPEVARLGLAEEERYAAAAGLAFRRLPTPDFAPPQPEAAAAFAARVVADLESGRHVAVHCRGGRGRSPTLAASVLRMEGMDASEAWASVRRARGRRVPETRAQVEFVRSLRRGG